MEFIFQKCLKDWQGKLDEFLRFNERGVLADAGAVSREEAEAKGVREYERFSERRRAALEAEGEDDVMRELEAAAKRVPKEKRRE